MNRLLSFGATLGIVLASVAGRVEAAEYIFTAIDYPGAIETQAEGINDSGQIVGRFRDHAGYHGFLLSGGVYTPINHPDDVTISTIVLGINSLDQIVGAYIAADGTQPAFYRDGNGYVDLVPFGSPVSWAAGINDSGMVIGAYQDAGGTYRGFLFDGSSYTTLNDPDAVETNPWGMNNAGVIVGTGWDSSGWPHPFLRDVDGTYTSFLIGGFGGGAAGINDAGEIVGPYGPAPDEHYGYVLKGGIGSTPDKLHPYGAAVTDALDINNLGQVVGLYTYGSYASGLRRGFLATPIPDIPGDYNCNGVVDGADYIVWRDTLGSTFDMRANGDNSGASAMVIDAADYAMWRAHFGDTASVTGATGSASAGAAIPEPASLLLAVLAATWLLAGAATKHRC